jgi:hypothetical protein
METHLMLDRRNNTSRVGDKSGGRFYVDDQRVRWQVFEFLQPSGGAPSLIFESRTVFRRVRSYKADWRTLSDADLDLLSWQT